MKKLLITFLLSVFSLLLFTQCKRGKQFLIGTELGFKAGIGSAFLMNSAIKADENVSSEFWSPNKNWGGQLSFTYIGKHPKHAMLSVYGEVLSHKFEKNYSDINYG